MSKYRVTRRFTKSRNNLEIKTDYESYEEAKHFVEEVCFSEKENYEILKDSNDFHEEFHGSREIVCIDILEGSI